MTIPVAFHDVDGATDDATSIDTTRKFWHGATADTHVNKGENLMDLQSLKVFISILIGGSIGGMLAMQFAHSFWWAGILIGGAAGVFAYAWKKIVVAAPKAWKFAVETREEALCYTAPKQMMQHVFWATSVFVVAGIWFIVSGSVLIALIKSDSDNVSLSFVTLWMITRSVLPVCAFAGTWLGLVNAHVERKTTCVFAIPKAVVLKWSPFAIAFWQLPRFVLWFIPKSLLLVVKVIDAVVAFIGMFISTLFRLINSDSVLIVGAYSLFAGLIGFVFQNVVIGVLIGAPLGALHDRLIRVYRPDWRTTK